MVSEEDKKKLLEIHVFQFGRLVKRHFFSCNRKFLQIEKPKNPVPI